MWSKCNKALSSGPKTTTWIWNLHDHAHDFDIQQSSTSLITRKVFSSNLAHLSLVFYWLSGMHFHGAYFSNYSIWLKDGIHYLPSSHLAYSLIGQDILNDHNTNQYSYAIRITSGFFQLWGSSGIITQIHLKYACSASLIGTIISISGSYFHMHILSTSLFYKKFNSYAIHHLMLILGLSCISWCGHQIHISLPANPLLDSGIYDPLLVIPLSDLLSHVDLIQIIFPGFRIGPLVNFAPYLPLLYNRSIRSMALFGCKVLNSSTTSVFLGQITFHHFTLGVVFIILSLIGSYNSLNSLSIATPNHLPYFQKAWHPHLSINLATTGSLSIAFADHIYAIPIYPFCGSIYPTVLCLFYHHMWNGRLLIVGGGAHASIHELGEALDRHNLPSSIKHRDVIIGHLIWVSIALGLHSFSLYIHNDTFQALRRPEDIFHDNSIQLKPVFSLGLASFSILWLKDPDIFVMYKPLLVDKKLRSITQELATADFIVHHIHAFTIHVALLILSKGILYARNSRLVSDKLELGFRYPCDGPGRGGTCQISPWDHLYLAVFWMYNSLDIVLFHFFWKMQSDVWGIYNKIEHMLLHLTQGDFSVNSTTINGWLRNFLWSQAAQGIQSYATSISGYGFIFISAHFIWAFSLMFLYSGRGYWQELIESILWAHHKLKIIPNIQPRALSISQGRALGFIHYTLGGILSTWAFFISRIVVLTN